MKDLVDEYAAAKKEAEGFADIIAEMTKRKKAASDKMEEAKNKILAQMIDGDSQEINWPEVTVKLKSLPVSIAAVDQSKVPEKYLTPQPPKLDKRELLKDAKKEPIEGVTLSNGGYTVEFKFRELAE